MRKGGKWVSPEKPTMSPVVVVPIQEANIEDNGFYLDRESANNLATNVEELKAYVEKLELKIKKMNKYYGVK